MAERPLGEVRTGNDGDAEDNGVDPPFIGAHPFEQGVDVENVDVLEGQPVAIGLEIVEAQSVEAGRAEIEDHDILTTCCQIMGNPGPDMSQPTEDEGCHQNSPFWKVVRAQFSRRFGTARTSQGTKVIAISIANNGM